MMAARDRALASTPNAEALRRGAVDQAVALFAQYDPLNKSYPAALANGAPNRLREAQYDEAATLNSRAVMVALNLPDHDDMDLALIYADLEDVLSKLGKFEGAEQQYDLAADLALRTIGERYGTYWRVLGQHAAMLCLHGDLENGKPQRSYAQRHVDVNLRLLDLGIRDAEVGLRDCMFLGENKSQV